MTAEWWVNGPDTVREPRDDGVDDDHDAHESAWVPEKVPCFLCAVTPLAPYPRSCHVCQGRGWVWGDKA